MPTSHLTAEEQMLLAARIAQRDQTAEGDLVRLFHGRIGAMMAVRTRNVHTAEDLTQETLMAVLVALRDGRLRATDRLAAFVYGVARNVLNDHLRGDRSHSEVPVTPEMCPAPAQDLVEEKEREGLVRQALATLASDERTILLMTLVDGLKPGVIAGRLSLTPDVCRARKSRALKKVVAEVERLSRFAGAGDHPGDGEV